MCLTALLSQNLLKLIKTSTRIHETKIKTPIKMLCKFIILVYHSPSHPFSLSTKGQFFNKENMFSFIKYALTLGICIPIALHFISLKMNKEDTQMFEKASQNFNSSTFIFFSLYILMSVLLNKSPKSPTPSYLIKF